MHALLIKLEQAIALVSRVDSTATGEWQDERAGGEVGKHCLATVHTHLQQCRRLELYGRAREQVESVSEEGRVTGVETR